VCCISAKTNAGSACGWWARAAAPPRSRSQYHPERDHVGGPDHPAGGQQCGGIGREQLVGGDDVADEAGGGGQVGQGQQGDDGAGGDPQPGFLPVDAARVPDDQGGQQREQDDGEHPRGVDPVFGGQRHMQANDDDDRQRHRPPVLTTFSGPQRRHRGRIGWLWARCHTPL
jgi:hypothetical protein